MPDVLVDAHLTDLDGLAGAELVGCTIEGVGRDGAAPPSLAGAWLEGCRLVDCDLRLLDLTGTRLADVAVLRCTLAGVDWTAASWPGFGIGAGLRLAGCTLDHGTFAGLALPGLVAYACSAVDVDLGGCDLTGADLRFTDLDRARLDGAVLRDADLRGATGWDLPLEGLRADGCRVSLPDAAVLLRRLGLDVQPVPEQVDAPSALEL